MEEKQISGKQKNAHPDMSRAHQRRLFWNSCKQTWNINTTQMPLQRSRAPAILSSTRVSLLSIRFICSILLFTSPANWNLWKLLDNFYQFHLCVYFFHSRLQQSRTYFIISWRDTTRYVHTTMDAHVCISDRKVHRHTLHISRGFTLT